MNKLVIFFTLFFISFITACESDQATRLQDSLKTSAGAVKHAAIFDPGNGEIPFPNNLLFKDSLDYTLNIPVADATDFSNPSVALNTLDGFSTIAPMSASFTTSIDVNTVLPPTVRVFQVTLSNDPGSPITSIDTELTFGVDFFATLSSVDTSNSTLVILPLKPLTGISSYFVVLTNGIEASDGVAFNADTAYALTKRTIPLVDSNGKTVTVLTDEEAAALEPLRQLTNINEAAMVAFDDMLNKDDIILSWTFTTQSIGDVLTKVYTDLQPTTPSSTLADSMADSPGDNADIYVGTLTLPYYLTAAAVPQDTAPLNEFWRGPGGSFLTQFNTTPVANETLDIPLMVSIPKLISPAIKPPGGWKTVLFQHGITANRTSMLAVADTLATAGFAVVAIDMPLHGLTGLETDGTENYRMSNSERIFDLDLVDNVTGAPGKDDIIDSSGKHFINLSNLVVSRDNVRQAVADLFVLTRALEGMDYDGITSNTDFDLTNIYFVGHSLGGIVGATFLALEPNVHAAVLGMSGGGIAKILDGSATFGPVISAGLAQKGVIKGTADFESFMGAAQTVLDSGDPINYTAAIAASRGVLLFEVVGGNSSPSDLVIPNKVPDANDTTNTITGPLSGTDPMAALMGLNKYTTSPPIGVDLKAWVRFSAGDHSSLLSPATSPAVTAEMQSEMATFLVSDGNLLTISNETVISPD